jgi:outer membrane protein OmpA-like peptidoglycan-associated protein
MRPVLLATAALAVVAGCSLVTVVQQPFEPQPIRARRPPPAPPRVVLTPSSIQITEKIQFALDSAEILAASHGLLGEIAGVLKENPQIDVLQIEGHTDITGSADHNRKLSQRRAESVRDFLVRYGIVGKRLVCRGFGPDRPVADNASEEGKERNRRVEFNIVKQGPKKTLVQDE